MPVGARFVAQRDALGQRGLEQAQAFGHQRRERHARHAARLLAPDREQLRDQVARVACRVLDRREAVAAVLAEAGLGARQPLHDETRAVQPGTDRARRRVDAERRLRWYGRAFGARVTLLRIPGIYAGDRPGGHPRERLARGTPVLAPEIDVYTNHIHADDLARACVLALHRGAPQRVLNVCDDTELKMGDYFDLAADLCGLARPRRVDLAAARAELSPMQLSFMGESRRLDNTRLKRELRLRLDHPTVAEGLLA